MKNMDVTRVGEWFIRSMSDMALQEDSPDFGLDMETPSVLVG